MFRARPVSIGNSIQFIELTPRPRKEGPKIEIGENLWREKHLNQCLKKTIGREFKQPRGTFGDRRGCPKDS